MYHIGTRNKNIKDFKKYIRKGKWKDLPGKEDIFIENLKATIKTKQF